MIWFWFGFSAAQLAVIIYLSRRLIRAEDRHAAAVRMAEEALHQADIMLKAVEHLQSLNAILRRQRRLILNGELFAPYTIGNNNPPTIWRIYPKQ